MANLFCTKKCCFAHLALFLNKHNGFPNPRQDFTLDFYFRQHWRDPRLSFPEISNLRRLTVGSEYLQRIWVPDTFFANEKKSYFHTATTSNEMLRITNEGNVLRSMRWASATRTNCIAECCDVWQLYGNILQLYGNSADNIIVTTCLRSRN